LQLNEDTASRDDAEESEEETEDRKAASKLTEYNRKKKRILETLESSLQQQEIQEAVLNQPGAQPRRPKTKEHLLSWVDTKIKFVNSNEVALFSTYVEIGGGLLSLKKFYTLRHLIETYQWPWSLSYVYFLIRIYRLTRDYPKLKQCKLPLRFFNQYFRVIKEALRLDEQASPGKWTNTNPVANNAQAPPQN
jgi:hypothetical protein